MRLWGHHVHPPCHHRGGARRIRISLRAAILCDRRTNRCRCSIPRLALPGPARSGSRSRPACSGSWRCAPLRLSPVNLSLFDGRPSESLLLGRRRVRPRMPGCRYRQHHRRRMLGRATRSALGRRSPAARCPRHPFRRRRHLHAAGRFLAGGRSLAPFASLAWDMGEGMGIELRGGERNTWRSSCAASGSRPLALRDPAQAI